MRSEQALMDTPKIGGKFRDSNDRLNDIVIEVKQSSDAQNLNMYRIETRLARAARISKSTSAK